MSSNYNSHNDNDKSINNNDHDKNIASLILLDNVFLGYHARHE